MKTFVFTSIDEDDERQILVTLTTDDETAMVDVAERDASGDVWGPPWEEVDADV